MMSAKRWLPVVLLCLLLGGLYYSSSQPYEKQDMRQVINRYLGSHWVFERFQNVSFTYGGKEISVARNGAAGFVEFFVRKAVHFVTFVLLTCLLYWIIGTCFTHQVSLPWSGLIAVVAAILDEWHQSFTPHRTPLIADVLLDTSGVMTALLGIVLVRMMVRGKRKRRRM